MVVVTFSLYLKEHALIRVLSWILLIKFFFHEVLPIGLRQKGGPSLLASSSLVGLLIYPLIFRSFTTSFSAHVSGVIFSTKCSIEKLARMFN